MNNKGFGLTEMLLFIVACLVILVITTIIINQKFNNLNNSATDNNIQTQIIGEKSEEVDIIEDDEEEEELTKLEKKYKELTDKMLNTAKIYVSNNYTGRTDKMVIKLSTLIEEGYMDQMLDPDDETILCNGYVTYNGEFYYETYLRCGDNYQTENYNTELE